MAELAYLRDGTAIYERSFAIIRAEADLERFLPDEAEVAVRMIHACGLVEAARYIEFGRGLVAAARAALAQGAPILCDAEMVAHGITRTRLPAKNEVLCMLRDSRVPALAERSSPAPSSPSATRRRRCSAFSKCSPPARRVRLRSSAYPSASSALPKPRMRWRPAITACPISS
jgi:precorrin isomerase